MEVAGIYVPLWIITASLAWITIMALWFLYKDKTRKIIVKYPYGDVLRKHTDVIDMPRTLVINLIVDSNYIQNDDISADMVIRYEDLIKGNYKVPDKYINQKGSVEIEKEEDFKANNNDDEMIISSSKKPFSNNTTMIMMEDELTPNVAIEEPFLEFSEENIKTMESFEVDSINDYPSEEEMNKIIEEDSSSTDFFDTQNFTSAF